MTAPSLSRLYPHEIDQESQPLPNQLLVPSVSAMRMAHLASGPDGLLMVKERYIAFSSALYTVFEGSGVSI